MKNFTDLFIRRPVLALVVSLVIFIAGLQAIRFAQRAAISAQRHRRRSPSPPSTSAQARTWCAASSPLRSSAPSRRRTGSITCESTSAQGVSTITARLKLNYDSNKALSEISSKVNQVRGDLPPEAEIPVINIVPADSQFASAYLSFTSDILQANEITDYLDPHRAAAPDRDRGRAAGGDSWRPHFRHAHLAEAGPDGGAQRQPGAGPHRRWPHNNFLSALG